MKRTWTLDKIFGLYTIAFIGVTVLIGLAEYLLDLPPKWIGWIFMALSIGIYVVIGIITRTAEADLYYVAGRRVPALYNGMATCNAPRT
jgi:cation/acetate symporter